VGVLVVGAIQAGTENISPAIFAALFFVVWINQWMPNPSGDGRIWFDRYVVSALLIYWATSTWRLMGQNAHAF